MKVTIEHKDFTEVFENLPIGFSFTVEDEEFVKGEDGKPVRLIKKMNLHSVSVCAE
jgi:hypothetical protein